LQGFAAARAPLAAERRFRRKDGTVVDVLLNASPMFDSGGAVVSSHSVWRDVTDRKRLAEARRRAEELEVENRLAGEASRLKSDFLANMSHELRTPLNAVVGFAELLRDAKVGPVNPQQKEFLRDILTSSRDLLQLINDVLDLARVEAGKIEFRPSRV